MGMRVRIHFFSPHEVGIAKFFSASFVKKTTLSSLSSYDTIVKNQLILCVYIFRLLYSIDLFYPYDKTTVWF